MKNTNSKKKMEVLATKNLPFNVGKRWVKVTLNSNVFIPSFEDIFRIIRAVCYCEDKKYPNGQGAKMVAKFLYDACFEKDFEKLAAKYNIPIREGVNIINKNGSNT